MASPVQPTIGRIVHYQSHGSPNGQHKSERNLLVETADVDLCVLNPTGMFFNQNVRYDESGAPGTWRWPPRA